MYQQYLKIFKIWLNCKPHLDMIPKNALLCCKLIHQESDELQDTRNLRDEDLRTLAHVILKI